MPHRRYADRVTADRLPTSEPSNTRLKWEIAIVLALSFGASAVYAVVTIIERVTRETSLASQTATINRALSERPWFDLIYQLLGFTFGLAPVALVIYLLWREQRPHLARLGFGRSAGAKRSWWITETGGGVLLAAAIGIPGLGFYLASKALGINVTVVPTSLDTFWWTIPVLVLAALRAALGEEIIVVAYLFERLRRLGLGTTSIIVVSAVLRGTYHLYQGFGGFLGNVIMGLIFGWIYQRTGRVLPLVIAHWVLDIVSFAGYPLALAWWPELFGVPGP
ncbi:CPBP family intramembrane glutamic endopeptidase [Leucobacter sp. W1153]|uniref:CPBP family intramembrane glutamic endopeptidase n=1 Tax=Leucobacter sp. W1153 TaxID=3439064 RepID=UPI003F3B0459